MIDQSEFDEANKAWDTNVKEVRSAVFDKATKRSPNPEHRIGFSLGNGTGGFSTRRTDRDRRPAQVVRRPNDGPGCPEAREKLSREIADRAARKAITVDTSATYAERMARRRHEVKMHILTFIGQNPLGVTARACISLIQTRPDYVQGMLKDLGDAGLIFRQTGTGGPGLNNTITDAGRAHLAGLGQ